MKTVIKHEQFGSHKNKRWLIFFSFQRQHNDYRNGFQAVDRFVIEPISHQIYMTAKIGEWQVIENFFLIL